MKYLIAYMVDGDDKKDKIDSVLEKAGFSNPNLLIDNFL